MNKSYIFDNLNFYNLDPPNFNNLINYKNHKYLDINCFCHKMYIWKHIKFDKNGIPIQHLNSNISYIEDNGEFYNPVEITNCAISLLQNYYLLQKDKDKQQFLKYANFCINNLDKNIFYYKFNANHCNRILKKKLV